MAKKKVTKNKKFTNLIIIDASGSMTSKIPEVVGGLKKLFNDIKEDAVKNPEVESTTIVIDFSDAKDYRTLVNSTNSNDLTDAVAESYNTRGWTALYDAMGYGFNLIPKNQDGVFINILTDGLENDSKEMSSADIKALVEAGKAKKWAITFMGASEGCLNTATNLGISKGNQMLFADTGAGVNRASNVSNRSRALYYTSATGMDSKAFNAIDFENLVTTVTENK